MGLPRLRQISYGSDQATDTNAERSSCEFTKLLCPNYRPLVNSAIDVPVVRMPALQGAASMPMKSDRTPKRGVVDSWRVRSVDGISTDRSGPEPQPAGPEDQDKDDPPARLGSRDREWSRGRMRGRRRGQLLRRRDVISGTRRRHLHSEGLAHALDAERSQM